MATGKSYGMVITETINNFVQPDMEVRKAIANAIDRVVQDTRLESLDQRIEALELVIDALARTFPNDGFAAWQKGSKHKEAIARLKDQFI